MLIYGIRFRQNTLQIRGGKKQTLRVGGAVEPPLVECDLDTFAFHGVHVGASLSKTFCLVNPMASEAEVVYNLNKYKDFKLEVPHRNFAGTLAFYWACLRLNLKINEISQFSFRTFQMCL